MYVKVNQLPAIVQAALSTNGDKPTVDYVPSDLNIGGGDYLSFDVCLDCGQMQGEWPKQ